MILIVIIVVFLFVFLFIEPILYKNKLLNNNEYGSARFSTKKEIKNNFDKEKISNINKPGYPILFSRNLKYVFFDNETPHWCFLGSTGSGKTVTALIPQCSFIATSKEKRSVVMTDPKGELFQKTSKMFKDNGYKIYTLDFRGPELSNHINILEPIISEYDSYIKDKNIFLNNKENIEMNNLSMMHYAEANRLINSVSSMVIGKQGSQKDPFWNNSAKNFLAGLISFFLESYEEGKIRRDQITLSGIKKFQNSVLSEDNFEIFKEIIEQKEYGLKSKDNLLSIISSSENTFKSIMAVFNEKMAIFDDVNVESITADSDFYFNDFGKYPTVLYIIVPDEDKTYYQIVTIIIDLIYKELIKLANLNDNKCLKVNVEWLLEEFANCPAFEDIESMVSVGRSRGMRYYFFIQSFSQLNNVYGKEVARIILDNCGLVYLKTNTEETADEISKRLGKKTIESKSLSQSVSLLATDGNKSLSLIGRDLMTADEVKRLHYKTIIFPIIGYPIIRNTVMYNKFSCYEAGMINRKVNKIKKFKDYYTVEKINDIDTSYVKNDFRNHDIQMLNPILKEIENLFSEDIASYDYKVANERTYLVVHFNNLKKSSLFILKNYLKDKQFLLIEKENSIEIHIKIR